MIILTLLLILPLLCAVLAGILPQRSRFFCAAAGLFLSLVLALFLIFLAAGSKVSASGYFSADGFAAFLAFLASFVGLLLVFCSREYFVSSAAGHSVLIITMVFFSACLGAIFSSSLLSLFACLEAAGFLFAGFVAASFPQSDRKEKIKIFLATGCGTALVAFSFFILTSGQKEFFLEVLKGKIMATQSAVLIIAAVLLRALCLPLYAVRKQLPKAALAAVCFFSVVFLLCVSVSVFTRLFYFTFFTAQNFSNTAIALSGILLLSASCLALSENNAARLLVYALLAQFGNIVFLLASANALSVELALLFVTAQSLGLAGIFVSSQAAMEGADCRPLCARTGFLLCAFSVIGIPPMAGFWPKSLSVVYSLQEGRFFIESIALLAAVMSLFYYLRAYRVLFPAGQGSRQAAACRFSVFDASILALVAFSLFIGIGIKPVFLFFNFLLK